MEGLRPLDLLPTEKRPSPTVTPTMDSRRGRLPPSVSRRTKAKPSEQGEDGLRPARRRQSGLGRGPLAFLGERGRGGHAREAGEGGPGSCLGHQLQLLWAPDLCRPWRARNLNQMGSRLWPGSFLLPSISGLSPWPLARGWPGPDAGLAPWHEGLSAGLVGSGCTRKGGEGACDEAE